MAIHCRAVKNTLRGTETVRRVRALIQEFKKLSNVNKSANRTFQNENNLP
jgi:hypothetical protein